MPTRQSIRPVPLLTLTLLIYLNPSLRMLSLALIQVTLFAPTSFLRTALLSPQRTSLPLPALRFHLLSEPHFQSRLLVEFAVVAGRGDRFPWFEPVGGRLLWRCRSTLAALVLAAPA